MPSAAVALASKFTCTLCLSAYAGVLSSLGLGALATERGLLVLTIVLVSIAVAGAAWTARRTRRVGPLALTLGGAAIVAAARGVMATPMWLYAGSATLVVAALWNLYLTRRRIVLVALRSNGRAH